MLTLPYAFVKKHAFTQNRLYHTVYMQKLGLHSADHRSFFQELSTRVKRCLKPNSFKTIGKKADQSLVVFHPATLLFPSGPSCPPARVNTGSTSGT